MLFDSEMRAFEDISGTLRFVSACPITRISRLKKYFDLFQTAVQADYPLVDFIDLYHASALIRSLTKEILEICGLSTDWVNLPMVEELIYHRRADDGSLLPGLLLEINFQSNGKQAASPEATSVGVDEWVANIIVGLVSLGLASSLEEALSVSDKVPHDELEGYLAARRYQLNPKLKRHEEVGEMNAASTPSRDDELILAAAKTIKWDDSKAARDIEKLI